MEDLISIIIPIYNVAEFLPRCLDSILTQKYKNLEVVCVDDGSTDRSGDICEEYSMKDDRVKVFHIKNGGVSNARNYGLKQKTGKWFAFVDGDDWLEPEYYEILFNNAKKNECDISACQFKRNDSFEIGAQKLENKQHIFNSTKECIHGFICPGISLSGQSWNKIYLSEKYGDIEFRTDIKVYEDCIYTYEIMSRCEKACVTEDRLYHWYFRKDSACHTKKIKADFTAANVFIELMDKTADMNDELVNNVLKKNYIFSVIKVFINADCDKKNKDVVEAKKNCKLWKKDVWEKFSLRDKLKYYYAICMISL